MCGGGEELLELYARFMHFAGKYCVTVANIKFENLVRVVPITYNVDLVTRFLVVKIVVLSSRVKKM